MRLIIVVSLIFSFHAAAQTNRQSNISRTEKAEHANGDTSQLSFGNEAAPVTITFLADFSSPDSKEVAQALRRDVPSKYSGTVRVIFSDHPDESNGSWSKTAAMAGRCIALQNRDAFWHFHDWVFAHQEEFTSSNVVQKIVGFARSIDLDDQNIQICLAKRATEPEIERSILAAATLAPGCRTALIIDGEPLCEPLGREKIEKTIQSKLAAKVIDNDPKSCGAIVSSCSAWQAH